MSPEHKKSISVPMDTIRITQHDESAQEKSDSIGLPAHVAGSGALDQLVNTARDYAIAAASDNTLKAYAKDWAHFARWCRMRGADPLPPSPELVGLYIADLMIAATALHHGAIVVTGNVSDFSPTGAAIENPFEAM